MRWKRPETGHRSPISRLMAMVVSGEVTPSDAAEWMDGTLQGFARDAVASEGLPGSFDEAEHLARTERSEEIAQRVEVPGPGKR